MYQHNLPVYIFKEILRKMRRKEFDTRVAPFLFLSLFVLFEGLTKFIKT
jgi:hypothetical protein